MNDQRYSPPRASLEIAKLESNAPAPVEALSIGGWLLLVGFGLIVSPFRSVYFLVTTYWPIFSGGQWEQLTRVGGQAYHPLWAPLLIGELVGTSVHILVGAVTLALFLKKSRRTPKWAIAWFGFAAAFVLVDHAIAGFIPAVSRANNTGEMSEAARTVITAAIWIPYFLVSKRVKKTFVR